MGSRASIAGFREAMRERFTSGGFQSPSSNRAASTGLDLVPGCSNNSVATWNCSSSICTVRRLGDSIDHIVWYGTCVLPRRSSPMALGEVEGKKKSQENCVDYSWKWK